MKRYILCALIMIYFSANLLFSQNFFDDGKKMFDAGKYNEALENFKKEIENPTSRKKIISYYYIGRTYEQLNNTQAALETYNKIIKEYPNNFLSESALKRIKTLEPLAKIDYNKMTATPQTPQATSQQSKKEQQPKTPPPSSKTEQQKKKSAPPQIKSELIKKEYTYSDELTARKNKTRKNVESEIKAKVRQPLQKKIETVKMIEEPLNPIVLAQQEINNSTTSITLSNETLKDKEEAPKISIPILPPQPVKISAETENLTDSKIEIFRNDTAIQLFKKTEELEQLFKSANDKLSKRLFMDSLEDFKKYADQAQDDNVKKEMAYYKIAEIYHILGQYQDAAKAYLEYIKRYENRQNTYRACFNLANIYFEALGLYNDAKKYYLLALDKTLNVEVINKIKDKITELDKQIKSIETQKQLTTSSPTAPSSAQTNLAAQVNTSGIKLSEKLASEKNIITTFDEEKTAPAQNLQTDLRSSPTAMAKPLITKPAPEMKMAVPEFKQIEPIAQKGRQRNISEIVEPKREFEYYITEGYKAKNMGMYGEAIKHYKTAIEFYPDNPIAYNNLAYLYSELEVNLEEALSLIETAIRLDTLNRGSYLDTLGWIYFKMGDVTKAREVLEKAVFYNPSAIRKYHLAQVYKKLNLHDKALIELKGAQILQPTGKFGETIKNEIFELQSRLN